MTTPIGQLVIAERYEELAAVLGERLACSIDAERLAVAIRVVPYRLCDTKSWPDDTWAMWLKNRLAEARLLDFGKNTDPIELPPLPLHVFFLTLPETPEMLTRLRGGDGPAKGYVIPRSKISKSKRFIRPIDRVAARVTKFPAIVEATP